jgi:predicted GNAT family N-acyltransferase
MIRGQVFVIEQDIDWAIEFDGLDQESVLFIAYLGNQPVGVARLHGHKIGRVATLPSYRRRGVAKTIMGTIEEYARRHDMPVLSLHAQLYVKKIYEKLGYVAEGDIFKEAGIDHIYMEKHVK